MVHLCKKHVQCKPHGQVQYNANYGSRDCRECPPQPRLGNDPLDIRRARKDPEKARCKRCPKGHEGTSKPNKMSWFAAMAISSQIANELSNEDQGARCGLGKPQARPSSGQLQASHDEPQHPVPYRQAQHRHSPNVTTASLEKNQPSWTRTCVVPRGMRQN